MNSNICIIIIAIFIIISFLWYNNNNKNNKNNNKDKVKDKVKDKENFGETITTLPYLPPSPHPSASHDTLTVAEALQDNNNKLTNVRYDIMDKQDTLNDITNRLNNLNFNITTLNKKATYKADGSIIFY